MYKNLKQLWSLQSPPPNILVTRYHITVTKAPYVTVTRCSLMTYSVLQYDTTKLIA